jgi:hypothetical protein
LEDKIEKLCAERKLSRGDLLEHAVAELWDQQFGQERRPDLPPEFSGFATRQAEVERLKGHIEELRLLEAKVFELAVDGRDAWGERVSKAKVERDEEREHRQRADENAKHLYEMLNKCEQRCERIEAELALAQRKLDQEGG